jgi:hypothetical protein
MAQDFLSQLFGGQPDYSQFMTPQQSQQAQSNALTSAGLNAAIALLGASGKTNRPISTGQVLGSALSAGLGGYQSSFDNQLRQMLAQGQLSDIQDKRVLREQQIKDIRTKELAQQQLTAALALPDPIAKIDALRALGRFDLVKDLAEGQIKVRQSGLGRPVGEAEAETPFTPYLKSQSPEVRIQAQQYDQGFRTGRITEDMVDRLTPALATMQASFNQQLESRADRLSREKREANERADKRLEGEKPTEGQRKTAVLAGRLEGALSDLSTLSSTAQTPELGPALLQSASYIPGFEILASKVTSSDRAKAEAAQLDALDAALTLGTGAAYTNEQLKGYAKSYFPQIGNDAATIAAKQVRFERLVALAREQAGPAAKSIDRAREKVKPFDLDEFVKKNRIDK